VVAGCHLLGGHPAAERVVNVRIRTGLVEDQIGAACHVGRR
jgi:hypothetical protein